MAQLNLITFEYSRSYQPERYGNERAVISGSALVEEGEDAFAIADAMLGRAKAVAYRRLGLALTKECGDADLAAVRVTAVPSAEKQASAPTIVTVDVAEALLPSMPDAEDAPEPAKPTRGRPKGSGGGTRKSKAEKDAEAAQAADALPSMPDDDAGPTLAGAPADAPAAGQPAVPATADDEDALMALLNQGDAPKPAAKDDEEIDNPTLMAACAEAAKAKIGDVVLGFLKQVGVDRVLMLDQAQRKSLVAQLAKKKG
jgi:hypothetical protein